MIDGGGAGSDTPGETPAIRGLRLWTWAAIAVAGIDLVFFTGASNFLPSPQARILNQLLMLASLVALAIAARRKAVDLRSPLVIPGIVFVLATLLATVTSQGQSTSLEALALILLAAPTYLVVRAVTWSPWLRPRLDRLIVAATLVFVVAYFVQVGIEWMQWWSIVGPSLPPLRPGDVGLTIGTVNAVGLYLELLVPLATVLAWRSLRRPAFSLSIGILGIAALVITGSRGAWLGTGVAVIVTGIVAWLLAGRPLPRNAERRGRAALIAIGVVGVVALLVLLPALSTRLLAGDAGRSELWSAAWSMFTSSPITGTGPGTFPLLRPLTTISNPSYVVLTTSHNSVLQVLTDAGLIGLAATALVVGAVARLGLPAIAGSRPGMDRPVAVAVVGGLLAMLVHSTVDTQFHIPGVVALSYVLVARLDPPVEAEPAPVVLRRVPVPAGLVAVVAAFALLLPIDAAMVAGAQANAALDRGDAATALSLYRSAASLHELAPYRLGEGVAASYAGDLATARSAFQRAAALHPLTFVQANLAGAEDEPARGGILDQVEAQSPYDPAAMANAAVLRFSTDRARSTDDLADAMAVAPTLVYSKRPPALFDDATWAAAQSLAVDRIGATDPATAAAVATIAGLKEEVARQAAKIGDSRVLEALGILGAATSGPGAGVDRARALLREAPGSQLLQRVLWLVGFQAKSQALVDEVRSLSFITLLGVSDPPMELVVDGRLDADWAWRMPRWPMASNFRNGPDRQYAAGMVTIEPVYRPKDGEVAAIDLATSVPTAR